VEFTSPTTTTALGAPIENRLEPNHDLRGLYRVGRRPHFEIDVRFGNPKLAKERIAHRFVVVLAGVDEGNADADRPKAIHHRRDLHEVRPCAHDRDNRAQI
jgi:hypothetical protein